MIRYCRGIKISPLLVAMVYIPFIILLLNVAVVISFPIMMWIHHPPRTNVLRGRTIRMITSNEGIADNIQTGTSHVESIFDLVVPEGRCVGVLLKNSSRHEDHGCDDDDDKLSLNSLSRRDHWIRQYLHPEEIRYSMQIMSDYSRKSFLLGRIALRKSLASFQNEQRQSVKDDDELFDLQSCALLKDRYGRPGMPKGFLGSISHKDDIAVGLVSLASPSGMDDPPLRAIGVDLERCTSAKGGIAKRVLTKEEILNLGQLTNINHEEEILLRFSVKEALYKAMHPLICQYIGFQEAEVQPKDDGTFDVSLNLRSGEHKRFGLVEAHWRRHDNFFLTSALIEMNHDDRPEHCQI